MRILIVASETPPTYSGVARSVDELTRGLRLLGHDVDVVSAQDMPRVAVGEFRFTGFATRWRPTRESLMAYDVINLHGPVPTLTDVFLLKFRKVPSADRPALVYTHHSSIDIPGFRPACRGYERLHRRLVSSADRIITTSEAYRSLLTRPGDPEVGVIPWGVHSTDFARTPRAPLPADGRLRILCVGQMRPYKGIDVLIEAVAGNAKFELTLVGGGVRSERYRAASEARDAQNVTFRGVVDREGLAELYGDHDVIVLPSTTRAEAFGLVLLEGMAAGCVPVASNLPGVAEVAGATGLLVQPGDAAGLAAALRSLADDPERLRALAVASAQRAQGMGWGGVVEAYASAFEGAVAARRQPLAATTIPNAQHLLDAVEEAHPQVSLVPSSERLASGLHTSLELSGDPMAPRPVLGMVTSPVTMPGSPGRPAAVCGVVGLRSRDSDAPISVGRRIRACLRRSTDEGGAIARIGGSPLVVALFSVLAANYAFGLAVAWLLTPEEFAAVAFVQALLLVGATALNSGPPRALAWALSRAGRFGEEATDRMWRGSIRGNLTLAVVLVSLLIGIQLSSTLPLISHGGPLVLTVALALPFFAINGVGRGALHGLSHFDRLAIVQAFEVAVKCVVGLALILLIGANALSVALGFLGGAVATTILVAVFLRGHLPSPRAAGVPRRVRARTVPLFIGTVGMALLMTVDILTLSFGTANGVTTAAVALYGAAMILTRLPALVAEVLMDGVFPAIARSTSDPLEYHRHVRSAGRWALTAALPVAAVLVAFPGEVLGAMFPAHYDSAAELVRLLAIGGIGTVVATLFGKALQALGHWTELAAAMTAGLAVEILALALLVPAHGAVGAAVAAMVGSWISALAAATLYLRLRRLAAAARSEPDVDQRLIGGVAR